MKRLLPALLCALLLPARAQNAAPLVPATDNLQVWVRAHDLTTLYADGARVSAWPDVSGGSHHLHAEGDRQPVFKKDGAGGLPAVVFAGDAGKKTENAFSIPLRGEWAGATLFVVGKNLQSGLLDSNLTGNGDLRTPYFAQLTGTDAALDTPFPAAAASKDAPALATIECARTADGQMRLATWWNGKAQGAKVSAKPRFGVIWRGGEIGEGAGVPLNGEISELLIYKGALSAAQRAATERYLLVKYGLAPANPGEKIGDLVALRAADSAAKPLPPVKTVPVKGGLESWLRAEDVRDAKDGAPVGTVPDAAKAGANFSTDDVSRPIWVARGVAGRPTFRFAGDPAAKPPTFQGLTLPLTGKRDELTVFAAGRGLWRGGLFQSAPGQMGDLRAFGFLQLAGMDKALDSPFPLIGGHDDEAEMVAIRVRRDGAGQYLESWANGSPQGATRAATLTPILYQYPRVGGNVEVTLNGDIAEMLVYNRALSDAERAQNERYLSEKYGVLIKTPAQLDAAKWASSHWTGKFPVVPHSLSWFGNSFSGKDDKWVQIGVFNSIALPDGRLAAISVWDEPHREIGFYKDGAPVGTPIHSGGTALATDGQWLYGGMSGMGASKVWLSRMTLDGAQKPWPEQKEWPTVATSAAWKEVIGLAVGSGEIYMAVEDSDAIRVFDANTGALKRQFALPGAKRLAWGAGSLWAAMPDGVVAVNADGTAKEAKIADVHAGALAFDGKGRLMVGDDGARQQVIFYDVTGAQPKEVATLGARGGAFAGPRPGALGDDRLFDIKGVGSDAQGQIFVTCASGLHRCYAPDGKLKWQVIGTQFVNTPDFDPRSDGTVIYTGRERFDFVPGGGTGSDWKMSAVTSDARRFPALALGGDQVLLRLLGGHLMRYSVGENVLVHQQEADSDIFAPVGFFARGDNAGPTSPRPLPMEAKGRAVWSDRNGNGRVEAEEISVPTKPQPMRDPSYNSWVDERGDIWEGESRSGFRRLSVAGFSPTGAPLYDLNRLEEFECPPEFLTVERVMYYPSTDTMYLGGTTWDNGGTGDEQWASVGREVVRYDNWSKPSRKVHSRMVFPPGAVSIRGMTVAPKAGLVFAAEMETATIFVYDSNTGKLKGIMEPDKKLIGDFGWVDIDSCLRAFERKNGEVLVLAEEDYHEKQLVYRLPAPHTTR